MEPSVVLRAASFKSEQEKTDKDDVTMGRVDEDADCETKPDETAPEKERQKIIRVDQIWDKKTRKYRFVKTAKPKNRKEKFERYVITVARRISTQGTFEGHYVVDIRGAHIQEAISEAYRHVEDVSFPKLISLDTNELKLLFYILPTLALKLEDEKCKENPDQGKVFELEAAVQFIREHYEKEITKLNEFPDNHRDFWTLWTLFPHHTILYSKDQLSQGRAYRVRSSEYAKTRDGSACYVLTVDYLDSDGDYVGYVSRQDLPPIPEFSGSKSIYELSYFPLNLHQDYPRVRKELITSGVKVLSLKGRHLQEYKGHALVEEVDKLKKFNSHGRVMIDPVTFDQVVPNNGVVPIIRTPLAEENLTEDQKMLLNPLLYGFSLGDKIWGAFAVSRLDKVDWNEGMVDSLVLASDRKAFIRDLVRYHGMRDNADGFDDFVRDKGKGLIGLLSGPPGVGKTLTAEAVAEIAHRPLYMISSGELGETSESVQMQLMRVMELAETWKAVVLLDEADVFLTERSNESLSQNAITSIFLRHLEYYQGILLLTTNRLTSCDEAFQSRIHFCFEYKNLDAEARESIWKTFLAKLKKESKAEVTLEEGDVAVLAQLPLNGRQIKNIVSISQAVATEREEPVTRDSIMLATSFANISWDKKGDSPEQASE